MVIGKNEMNKGTYYWELKIDQVDIPENVMVGVTNGDYVLGENPIASKNFWFI